MPSSYTPSLRLVLPVTGELTGTWGDVTNQGLTELVDASIAGTASITMSDANFTLSTASGTADEARKMFVVATGALTAARNIICPTVSKLYFVANNTTGGFAVTFKTSAGTGISIPNGSAMVLYCNGTNVVDGVTYLTSLNTASLTAASVNIDGGTIDGTVVGGASAAAGTFTTLNATALTATADSSFNSTGAVKIPVGTTAQRPTAADGKIRFNSDTDKFEGYDGTAWGQLGGGATGGGADQVFVENDQVVTTNYTIPATKNAMSTGPITINSGVTVTVSSGARYVVI
jgi:hypothetical protein